MTNEILSEEQLDTVAGGDGYENKFDRQFFHILGNDVFGNGGIQRAFSKYGVEFSYCSYSTNDYKINGQKYPHWAVLGYVLSKKQYPGFESNWTDSKYVHSFLQKNFHMGVD